MALLITLLLGCILTIGQLSAAELPLHRLTLPEGYSIAVVSRADNVRQMALEPPGTLYAGSRRAGKVYRLRDLDSDGYYEQRETLLSGLKLPTGVAYRGGDLYIATVDRILKLPGIDQLSKDQIRVQLITDKLPDITHHGWKYLKFGPDNQLYFNLGAPCNVCLHEDPRFATILRLDMQTNEQTIVARGVRNSVGFSWHPETGELWFTDNGRDHLGDDLPDDELNRLSREGQHFGFPYIHAGDVKDPDFYEDQPLTDYEPPALKLGAHVAPLGITFYTGQQFPGTDQNHAFIAQHGSWNRSSKVGYRVVQVDTTAPELTQQVFIEGWLKGESAWGRPVDIIVDRDGSLLISDDKADAIYRVSYNGS